MTPPPARDPSEEWRDVPGYEWLYRVSNQGQVFSVRANRLLKPFSDTHGYFLVSLCTHGIERNERVHRLVLLAFVGPCPDGMQGAHLNGKRTDNRIENLAWATQSENERHKILHGTQMYGEGHRRSKLTVEQAAEAIQRHRAGESSYQIGRRFGVSSDAILKVVNGKTWTRALAESNRPTEP